MRKGLLLATLVLVGLVAAALVGLVGTEGAVGAHGKNKSKKNTFATLEIQGLTPAGEPIEVLAYSWGASNSGSVGGPGGGAGAGKVNLQDLSFTKAFDKLSPKLLESLAAGKHFPGATLLVDADGPRGNAPTHKYKFGALMLTSLSQGGSSGEQQLTENVTLNFVSVVLTNE